MSDKTTAFVFPGQGSQFVGMGRDVADGHEEVRALFAEANQIMGRDLTRVMFDGPEEELRRTENTQPAVLVFSVALHRILQGRGLRPSAVAGHSLGEYTALVAAGVLDFAAALRVVKLRGELMGAAGDLRPGTMAAIMGLDDAKISEICAAAPGIAVIANQNAPGQTVISGEVAAVQAAMEACKAAGAKRALPIPVSGAFHSPLMEEPNARLIGEIDSLEFREPRIPVVCNVDGKVHTSADEIRALLKRQMVSGVLWTDTVETLLALGTQAFVEVGPGKVLSGLVKRIAKDQVVASVGSAVEVEALVL